LALRLSELLWLTAGIPIHTPLARDAFTYIDQLGVKRSQFRPAFAAFSEQLGVSLRF
jgi:hypothetical protein